MTKPAKLNPEILHKLQQLCSYLGKSEFLNAVTEVLYRASESTIELEDKTVSEGYQIAACYLQDFLDEEERAA